MDGDMNDIFQKLNSILADKETSENLKNILNNFSSSNNDTTNSNDTTSTYSNTSNSTESTQNEKNFSPNFSDFDIGTILKIKTIMDNFNNSKNDPRANLLQSLKPYLTDSKKEKVDQYIKFLNLAKVIEVMNPLGGGEVRNE